MKIALLNENSQVAKNKMIFDSLKLIADEKKYQVYNLGMIELENENSLTYVQLGILASILLTTKTVDFVVTGCGTGQGAMLSCNSFPNVNCGLIVDPTDAYLFSQINDGNAISLPFAKGFGWGSELTLQNIFRELWKDLPGDGYPKDRREPEQKNKKILDEVKEITHKSLLEILKTIDQELLKGAISNNNFRDFFFETAESSDIKSYLESLI